MCQYETVLYSVEERVATITLNRPDALNTFNSKLRSELLAAVQKANEDANVGVVILAAMGRGFSAGADLTEKKPPGWSVERELTEDYKPILMAIHESPKLYITAVQGVAAGAGSAFALAGDLCVMAEDAYLYEAFAAIGLVPDCGASWFLTQQLGPKKALELIVSGEKLSAEGCLQLGLVNRVVKTGELGTEVRKLALSLAQKAPLALQYSKKLVSTVLEKNLDQAINLEADYQGICINSADFAEGTAAFFSKRKPIFTGK